MKDPLLLKSRRRFNATYAFFEEPEGAFLREQERLWCRASTAPVLRAERQGAPRQGNSARRHAYHIPATRAGHRRTRDVRVYTNDSDALADAQAAAKMDHHQPRASAGGVSRMKKTSEVDFYLRRFAGNGPRGAFVVRGDRRTKNGSHYPRRRSITSTRLSRRKTAPDTDLKNVRLELGESRPQREENVQRSTPGESASALHARKKVRETAERAFRYLTAPEIANRFRTPPC